MVVVSRGDPIPNDVSDFSFAELFKLYRNATDPEMRELVNSPRDRQNLP